MYRLPKPKKVKPKITEESLIYERIQKVRDDFEYNKREILRKLKER